MKNLLIYGYLVSLFLLCCQHDNKATCVYLLSNERINKKIAGGEIDTFNITLETGRFVFASIFQMGIDLYIKLSDPQNNIIQEIDNLKSGPEFISFTTTRAGIYKILVQSYNPMAQAGKYTIRIEKNIKTDNAKNELVNQVFAEFDNNYRPGAAVAIVESAKVMYENGFGISNFDNKTSVNPASRMNICSIGKQFTAFAIVLLEQQGKLSLDDDIRKYLPELYDFDSKITIQNLLNHSSGLREIADLLEISGIRCGGPFSKADVMKLICRQKELNFKPGSEYLYCNTGYILLAEIIERITHQTYGAWMTDNIFKPLGMNNTYVYYEPDNFIKDFAWSYSLDNNRNYKKESFYKTWYVGAGNVFSSAEDMGKWIINLDFPRVGNAQLISRLRMNQIPMDKDSTNYYACGIVSGKYKGLDYYWHGGGGYGYTSQIIHFPEYKFGAIILSNFIYGGVYSRARQIADIYLGNHFTQIKPALVKNSYSDKPVVVDNTILKEIEGIYLPDSGMITRITRKANELFIQSAGSDKTELYPLSDSIFFIKEADFKLSISRNQSGQLIKMKSYSDGKEEISQKIAIMPEDSIDYNAYIGKYYSEELNTSYNIYRYGNTLMAHHNVNGEISLSGIHKNLFKGNRWYFSLVQFDTSGSMEINEFSVTNERVRNIRFKKVLN